MMITMSWQYGSLEFLLRFTAEYLTVVPLLECRIYYVVDELSMFISTLHFKNSNTILRPIRLVLH